MKAAEEKAEREAEQALRERAEAERRSGLELSFLFFLWGPRVPRLTSSVASEGIKDTVKCVELEEKVPGHRQD